MAVTILNIPFNLYLLNNINNIDTNMRPIAPNEIHIFINAINLIHLDFLYVFLTMIVLLRSTFYHKNLFLYAQTFFKGEKNKKLKESRGRSYAFFQLHDYKPILRSKILSFNVYCMHKFISRIITKPNFKRSS